MIKLTDTNGGALYLPPTAIASIRDADSSDRRHGIRSYVRTIDHRTYEVQQTAEEVNAALAAEQQPCGMLNGDQEVRS